MSVTNLSLRGTVQTTPSLSSESSNYFTLVSSISISPPTRSDSPEHKVTLDENSLIELVLEDGTVWFGDRQSLHEFFPEAESGQRGEGDVWVFPAEIDELQTDRNILKKMAIKVLNVFTRKGTGVAVKAVAQKLEEKQLESDQTRVFRVDHAFKLENIDKVNLADGEYLVLIHGTASSTAGSFDKLIGSGVWEHIKETYRSNILALQHRTLTENPLENLLVLVKKLPSNCTLDIISHSRGGLVADLLCRFAINKRGFDDAEILLLEKEKRSRELELIAEVEKEIAMKRISVRRQVRVACPARGTTLASKRLDTMLNVILNLIGSTNPFVLGFKELIAAVIDSKNQADVLPGIEAMNPESPFVKALNFAGSGIEVQSPLMVIAGNSKAGLKLRGLVVLLSKLFYLEGNDLIVNTSSMYQGAKRIGEKSFYYLESTADTHHFAYFANHSSRTAILSALKYSGEGKLAGFEALGKTLLPETERNAMIGLDGGKVFRDEVSCNRPIVVLLPGIMGSNLQVKDNVVWINYLRFLAGEMTSLEYTEANNKQIKAHSLIKTSYKKLVDYLITDYDVVTFPFDWRKPLPECADQLDHKLKELMHCKQPIKIIAHSMGGVLARDLMVYHPDTWKQLNALSGFQLIMLGTPLGGSYRIPYVLFGFDDIIKKLAAIDIRNSKKELLTVFSNLPGLLSLLPMQDTDDFSRADVWKEMQKASGEKDWPIPGAKVLEGFAKYQAKIKSNVAKIDYKKVVYIAGACRKNKTTPAGFKIENEKLVFIGTQEGDESVTWATGIPKELKDNGKVYYSNTTHGELANDAALFPAITEILRNGGTGRLPVKPAVMRGKDMSFAIRPSDDLDMTEKGIEKTLLGLGGDDEYKAMEIPLKVSVTNGDLSFAQYPILVGHFYNDGIVSAEKAIDHKLDGELSRRHKLGLHPDLIEENEVLLTDRKPGDGGIQGVIIVGLGYLGELTSYQLMRTIERGISKYLSIINVKGENLSWHKDRPVLGISTLLIGGSYGGLTIDGSINAILNGIQQANINFRNVYPNDVRLIDEVEIIELYRDRALSAIHVIKQIEKDESRSLNIVLNKKTAREKLGPRMRIPLDSRKDWWTRITVRKKDESEKADEKSGREVLKMTISTTGAREESKDLLTASNTLMTMIKEMSVQNNWSPAHAITLFELLIHNDFKEQLRRQNNILWVVDKFSASIPWELIMDKTGKEQPLCINAGMIRQLTTRDSRIKVFPSGERNALVVADPELNGFLSQLGGAYREGIMATDMLKNNAYNTQSLLKSNAGEILKELMCRNYQVIHLAGHGVFDPEKPEATGMVIGNGAFLTVAEIAQMDTVPELVFVNCCYLGATNENAEMNRQGRYRLAANIGTQLIENGVKAVVVAGWAVQDNAALSFAQTFYQNIFSGITFGESVKRARKKIFLEFENRNDNTWGAYQCYGDPHFQLVNNSSGNTGNAFDFVIPDEPIIELTNIINQVDANLINHEWALKLLEAVSIAADAAGFGKDSRVLEKIALLYGKLGIYEKAISCYKDLMEIDKADFPFLAIEQYCNIRIKYLAHKNIEISGEILTMADDVVEDLEALLRFGHTTERLSLKASGFKRLMLLYEKSDSHKAKASNALDQAAKAYAEAYQFGKDPYPLSNWIQLNAINLLSAGENVHKERARFEKEAKSLIKERLEKFEAEKEKLDKFWKRAELPNLMLSKFLLGHKDVNKDKVFNSYKDLWGWAGSKNDKEKEIEHLETIECALRIAEGEIASGLLKDIQLLKQDLIAIL